MRAIDADAFKNYIRGACEDMKHLYKDNGAWAKEITESFCKDIDEQPTIHPEPHWIPVEQELPQKNGAYLVTAEGFPVSIKFYSADSYGWGEEWHRVITAWQPLPEPFKGVTT